MTPSLFPTATKIVTPTPPRLLSQAESDKEISQSAGPLEFRTIGNYSSLINTFTLILVYSCYVPIIAPLGLVFLLLKHWTDKYQIMNRIVVCFYVWLIPFFPHYSSPQYAPFFHG